MESKVILVTGCSKGIGRAIVESLSHEATNATLLVSARKLESATEVVESLQKTNPSNKIEAIELDVTSDDSVKREVALIEARYGRLDVLINNAGIAVRNEKGLEDFRDAFNSTMDTNVTSVGMLTTTCIPLLEKSTDARIITVSSARASIHALLEGTLPPTRVLAYTVSKVAVNVMSLEMRKLYPKITFHCASPGHCSTALNGFQGHKETSEGARVIVVLALAEAGEYEGDFWEFDDHTGMQRVKW